MGFLKVETLLLRVHILQLITITIATQMLYIILPKA